MQEQAHQHSAALPNARPAKEITRGKSGAAPLQLKTSRRLEARGRQYAFAVAVFAGVSLLDLALRGLIGYEAIALVNLLAVVGLALFVSRGPILLGTALTALGWNFLCVPPLFSFHVSSFYDKMMFATYFAVALTVGQLTGRLRALHDAEIKTKLLTESERLSRTLLNSVSHELRTPLAAITSAAHAMHTSGPLTPTQEKLAAEIEAASARLNRVVQSLLNAARAESGQLRAKPDWCDLPDLVRVTLKEIVNLTEGHPIAVKIAPTLPLVKLDFVLTQQVLANLVVNAATHTPVGTVIDIMARIEDPELILQVADRGPGLPAEQLRRIFELFYRTPNARPGGTGLGLAIVKGFVEAQGGRVWAHNRAGGGVIFTIAIPLADTPNLPEET